MIGQASSNSRCSAKPSMNTRADDALGKTTMRAHPIVVGLIQVHLPFEPDGLFGKANRLTGQASVLVSQIQVVPFDAHRLNPLQGDIPKDRPFENANYASFFIPFLYHLSVTQSWAGYYFGTPGPASFPGAGKGFDDMVTLQQAP